MNREVLSFEKTAYVEVEREREALSWESIKKDTIREIIMGIKIITSQSICNHLNMTKRNLEICFLRRYWCLSSNSLLKVLWAYPGTQNIT